MYFHHGLLGKMDEGPVAATNRSVKLLGASFLRFNTEGLITEEHRYYDQASLFEQLGLG